MAFEWVAGLFSSDNQQTRGLSGDQAHSVALDDSNPYYNFRLRRHKAEGDLIGDPGLLWYTSPYVKRRSGLGTHVSADVGEGSTANYTDVLLVLSREDFARAKDDWHLNAIRTLQQEFDNFCRRENYSRLHAHRPLGVKILEDGSPAMGGQSLGLGRGEFITGILPNLYTGPVRGSYPVIGVHLNLPGVWEGYQEVGRLYNDQSLFTLGNHWLDNFHHPTLQQAALYRLRQYPDGSFVHIINPDLQDQYQVSSTNQGGASVLTLATRSGLPLAYMVLAVIDPPSARPAGSRSSEVPSSTSNGADRTPSATGQGTPSSPASAQKRPDIQMPRPSAPAEAVRAAPTPADSAPSIAPPMLLDEPSLRPGTNPGALGGKTIIPDMPQERVFTLQERGALLQKVHFANFMLGYDVYLGQRGELGTHVETPAATFQVRRRSVSLVAHVDGVVVGGRPVPAGVEVPIEGDVKIEVAGQKMEYSDLRGLTVEGWPYVGEIRRPASSTYMIWGEDYQIGRSRECRVVLPDEPRNDNIHWKPSIGDGATIRARSGEIPKSRFYTDSIMVASEHAGLDLRLGIPKIVCTARYCYVYVRRNGEVFPMFPATSPQQPKEIELQPGDEILIGNCLFYVGFTPVDGPVTTPNAPALQMSTMSQTVDADALAGAVARPDLRRLEAGSMPPEPDRIAPSPVGMVQAANDDRADAADAADLTGPGRRGSNPSTAGALGAAAPIEHLGDEDEPTVPGLVLPKDVDLDGQPTPQRAQQPGSGFPSYEPTAAYADNSVDTSGNLSGNLGQTDDAQDNSRDEWSEEESALSEPPQRAPGEPPVRASTVPTPFPEVARVDETPISPEYDREGPPSATWPPESGDLYTPPPESTPRVQEEPPVSLSVESVPRLLPRRAEADVSYEELPASAISELTEPPSSEMISPPPVAREAEPPTLAPPVALPPGPPAPQVVVAAQAAQSTSPPLTSAPSSFGEVVATSDAEAQFELGRPMHLVLVGWSVNGEVTIGNHRGAALVIPENRIDPGQTFSAWTYMRVKVRGRKGTVEVLAPNEVLVDEAPPTTIAYDDPEAHTFDVIRRDDGGEEDFRVRLRLVEDKRLPDPRARLIALDHTDPLSAALVTRGLPKGAPRTLVLDGLELTLRYDGAAIGVSDYLATYRRGDGFAPFFVSRGEGRFRTAPEDGAPFELAAGDRMVVGHCVYELRAE